MDTDSKQNIQSKLAEARSELNSIYKEFFVFYIGVFFFLSGVTINLASSLIYDAFKQYKLFIIIVALFLGFTMFTVIRYMFQYRDRIFSAQQKKFYGILDEIKEAKKKTQE